MKLKKVETGFVAPDLIPVIDIVFQLIALLIVALSFENSKADERIKLPRDSIARPPSVKSEHELVLNVVYRRDYDGNRLNAFPEVFYNEQYVAIGRIQGDLRTERRVLESVYGRDVLKNVTVVIRAEAEVPAGLVQELIKQCQEVGLSKFSMRTTEEEL